MIRYSIIIPAYNESVLLPATLEAVTRAMRSADLRGEVIVTDNHSTDDTADVARQFGARVVFEPVNQIARARNAGARAAADSSQWFIFLDADTILSPEILRQALDSLAGGTCCGGGALVRTDHPMPLPIRCFLGAWNLVARRIGWAAGCFIFCLREGYEAVGGFDERFYAGEEVWFSNRVRKWGKRRGLGFRILSEPPVVTSGRKAKWFNSRQFVSQLGLLMIVPWAARSKRWCSLWYRRPESENEIS